MRYWTMLKRLLSEIRTQSSRLYSNECERVNISWILSESQISGAKMASTMVFAGEQTGDARANQKARIWESIVRLNDWLEKNDYRGYDTFDGLSAKFLRPLTFETKYLRIVLQQSVRRFPFNLRPILGIPKDRSSKGMAYLARGYMRLHDATGDETWGKK